MLNLSEIIGRFSNSFFIVSQSILEPLSTEKFTYSVKDTVSSLSCIIGLDICISELYVIKILCIFVISMVKVPPLFPIYKFETL